LDKSNIDNTPLIFLAYQQMGKATNEKGWSIFYPTKPFLTLVTDKQAWVDKIEQFTAPNGKSKQIAFAGRKFSIKLVFLLILLRNSILKWTCVLQRLVAVFDTVGALGIPKELRLGFPETKLFTFNNDLDLGSHVERALQALALNETRDDFVRYR
jgi:hypothetical protein